MLKYTCEFLGSLLKRKSNNNTEICKIRLMITRNSERANKLKTRKSRIQWLLQYRFVLWQQQLSKDTTHILFCSKDGSMLNQNSAVVYFVYFCVVSQQIVATCKGKKENTAFNNPTLVYDIMSLHLDRAPNCFHLLVLWAFFLFLL